MGPVLTARLGRSAAGAMLAALLAGAPVVARADALDQLRAALRALAEDSPVRAEVVREVTYEQADNAPRHGKASVAVAQDRDGLRIAFGAEPLAQAAREHAQTDPDQPRPVIEGLRSIDPTEVHALLGYARRLLANLEGATLVAESESTHDGAPARLLEMQLPVRLTQAGRKRIKEARSTLKLWAGPDHLPLALEERSEYRGRIFLIIGFEVHQSRQLRFGRAGNRLVVLREESRGGGSGMGESAAETRITTLRVL